MPRAFVHLPPATAMSHSFCVVSIGIGATAPLRRVHVISSGYHSPIHFNHALCDQDSRNPILPPRNSRSHLQNFLQPDAHGMVNRSCSSFVSKERRPFSRIRQVLKLTPIAHSVS